MGEGNSAACVLSSLDDGAIWSNGPAGLGPYTAIAHSTVGLFCAGRRNSAATDNTSGTAAFAAAGNAAPGGGGTANPTAMLGIGADIVLVGQDRSGPPELANSATSADGGAAWVTNGTIFDTAADRPRALASNGTRVVAVGDGCRVDHTNVPTPLNWNAGPSIPGCAAGLKGVAYDSRAPKWYAVGHDNSTMTIYTSDDGVVWAVTASFAGTLPNTIAIKP